MEKCLKHLQKEADIDKSLSRGNNDPGDLHTAFWPHYSTHMHHSQRTIDLDAKQSLRLITIDRLEMISHLVDGKKNRHVIKQRYF